MTGQAFLLATVDGPGPAGRTAQYVDLARLADYLTRAAETLAAWGDGTQSFWGDTPILLVYTKVTPNSIYALSGGLKLRSGFGYSLVSTTLPTT